MTDYPPITIPDSIVQALMQEAIVRAERALQVRAVDLWKPNPGPQSDAYYSEADELFFGGAAGGGKTSLLLGLAMTAHKRSIIFRREYSQMRELEDQSRRILAGTRASYNGQMHIWRDVPGGRVIEFGSVPYDHDVQRYQGRPHDLVGFDEITHFTEEQYRFLIAWNRSEDPNQRVRVVATGNPPSSQSGEWVIRYWAPWLHPHHPNPARPGELRYFAVIDGKDVEVDSGEPFMHNGELVVPRSRTFIPARLEDNPHLAQTNYRAVLQSLQEPLRSQLLYGDFKLTIQDDEWQVIPTEWVRVAQERWRKLGKPDNQPMRALGVDVARGGSHNTVLAPLWGEYFGELVIIPGYKTKDGAATAAYVYKHLKDEAVVYIDVIGAGSSAYDVLKEQLGRRVVGVNAAGRSRGRSADGHFPFHNMRAQMYWRLREALDPTSGIALALPPDHDLLADLTTPRYSVTARGILIESKQQVADRLGRSPDKGDAVALAWCCAHTKAKVGRVFSSPIY